MSKIKILKQRAAELVAEEKDVLQKHADLMQAGRDAGGLSDEQRAESDGLTKRKAEIREEQAQVAEELATHERLAQLERETPIASISRVEVGNDLATEEPWANDDEFYAAVIAAGQRGGTADPRLLAGPTGGSTGVPSDGGFFVGRERSMRLMEAVQEQAILRPRCDTITIGDESDGVELPYIDETSRADGSRYGGVRVYRRAEADSVTATKPKYAMLEVELEDLMGLTYLTKRQQRNAGVTRQIVERAFASEFGFTIDSELFSGNGAGRIKGAFNAANGSLIVVAKEAGQAADTIKFENVLKMWSRMHARSRANAVWYINQDCEPQLYAMSLVVGDGGVPVYLPANGISGAPYATLFGRPVIPLEHCSTIGDQNDIVLADYSQQLVIEQGGMEAAESIHVRFLHGESALRWIVQINGAPKWRTALTPHKGSNTQSPFITLAARA